MLDPTVSQYGAWRLSAIHEVQKAVHGFTSVRLMNDDEANVLVINYRVARLPHWPDQIEDHGTKGFPWGAAPRCFMVHEERIRGWLEVLYTTWRADQEVKGWPAGYYIVRDPIWHEVDDRHHYPGFRGWRWLDGDR